MDLGLEGRAALVTGASRGIAAALVAEGARVAVSSRSEEAIAATAAEIGATGLVWDSADTDGAAGLVAAAQDALGAPLETQVHGLQTSGPGGPRAW